MTFADFNELNLEQRIDAIWEWGFYLGKCKNADHNQILYSINGYFAEMIINIADNKVSQVIPMTGVDTEYCGRYGLSQDNPFVRALSVQD